MTTDFPFFYTPYVLAEFGCIFVTFVPERTCMVSVAFLERCVTQSNVCFFCLWSRDLCLICDVTDVTISLKWTAILVAAIAVGCFRFLLTVLMVC